MKILQKIVIWVKELEGWNFPRAGTAASRDIPWASPLGNPFQQPSQPLKNPICPYSFTRINQIQDWQWTQPVPVRLVKWFGSIWPKTENVLIVKSPACVVPEFVGAPSAAKANTMQHKTLFKRIVDVYDEVWCEYFKFTGGVVPTKPQAAQPCRTCVYGSWLFCLKML